MYHSWLIEVPTESAQEELIKFCVNKAIHGDVITSVQQIFACSNKTPKVRVLSTPEYKKEIENTLKKKEATQHV